jgi:hypothetical protein
MADVIMRFPTAVADIRGVFHVQTMARERDDGSWEGWLEFVPDDAGTSIRYVTPIETHQRDRVTMERWASGLTHVYAEGALSRAQTQQTATAIPEPVLALQEFVEALDHRIPQLEQAGEARIAADAAFVRADAIQRIAVLRRRC